MSTTSTPAFTINDPAIRRLMKLLREERIWLTARWRLQRAGIDPDANPDALERDMEFLRAINKKYS